MNTKYIHIISALALLSVSCQQGSEEQLLPSNGEMSFNIIAPNGGTRVIDGAFEAGDKIGVYVTDYADATTSAPLQISGNRANNEVMSYDGTKWVAERPIYWGDSKADVYAYYPYMDVIDVDEQPFSVALDQHVEDCYESSDFLWAKAVGVAQTNGAVPLAMKHTMSRLVVKIKAGEDYIGSLPADATVHLHSTVTDALVSLANGSVVKNPYGGTHSIKMRNLGIRTFADGEAVVYEAIVVPQMLETSVPLLEINAKSISYLLEDMFNFKPGTSYTYTVVLNTSTTAIKIDIGCETDDWNNIGGGSEGEGGGSDGGEDDGIDLAQYTDLSAEGTANCYLVKAAGKYRFKAVQGNSDWSVGNVKKTEVLWESFGTDVMPNVGDLIATTGYKNGYIYFTTSENFNNGNASIAARNSKGVILWSWHIWCSAEGWVDQVYANDAGTLMDRNLGAISALPDDVGAFGLFYQWGRKDPFMGRGSLLEPIFAVSTGVWSTISSQVTLNYAEENPMEWGNGGSDWCTDTDSDLRWSDSKKTMYDPCPVGYRVPYGGGKNGFWEKANYQLADGDTAWYPPTGHRNNNEIVNGHCYRVWSATMNDGYADGYFQESGGFPLLINKGASVRCMKE